MLAAIGISPEHPAQFTILTQKGRPSYERGVSVIRDELKKIGVTVDVASLEGNALIQQILSGKYDAVYMQFSFSDTDPAMSPDFWPSSGPLHVWNREQKTPATPWEAAMDDLFRRQTTSADMTQRRKLFNELQSIFVEHEPMIYFGAPRVFVVSSSRVGNVAPSAGAQLPPRLLWSPDTLTVTRR
jgi:peptide/nickel transport system substrate-binding protein